MPLRFNSNQLGKFSDKIASRSSIVARLQAPLRASIATRLLQRDLVRKTPKPRTSSSPRFIWSRDKAAQDRARRWWFAAIARGEIPTNGQNYQRTGQLQRAWKIEVTRKGTTLTLIAANNNRGAVYVYGDYGRPQIPGHRATGWPNGPQTFERIADDIAKDGIIQLGKDAIFGGDT